MLSNCHSVERKRVNHTRWNESIHFNIAENLVTCCKSLLLSTPQLFELSNCIVFQIAFVNSLGPGTAGRGVLGTGTAAHAQAQARVCNMDMKYNHMYYISLHYQRIQECERAIYEQSHTK